MTSPIRIWTTVLKNRPKIQCTYWKLTPYSRPIQLYSSMGHIFRQLRVRLFLSCYIQSLYSSFIFISIFTDRSPYLSSEGFIVLKCPLFIVSEFPLLSIIQLNFPTFGAHALGSRKFCFGWWMWAWFITYWLVSILFEWSWLSSVETSCTMSEAWCITWHLCHHQCVSVYMNEWMRGQL